MAEPLSNQIMCHLLSIKENYYQLLIIVGLSGTGKTAVLCEVQKQISAPLINVNLSLSRQMLDLTERQRALLLPRLLGEIVNAVNSPTVLLDNIEVLFDISLKQDPLRLLQNLSRNKTIIVTWNGSVSRDQILYATPEHLEYRRYPIRDFLVVSTEVLPWKQGISE